MPLQDNAHFQRNTVIVVGNNSVENLRCTFSVKRSTTRGVNTCDLKVYNAKPETFQAWLNQKKPPVRVDAGYGDRLSTIFLGVARFIEIYREGNDTIAEISAGDGEDERRSALVYKSFGPKFPAHELLREVATAIGVKPGNLEQAVKTLETRGVSSLFSEGGVLAGNAADQMTRVCNSYGLEWSIQNGALQITEIGKAVSDKSVLSIGPKSGLIGSPRLNQKGELSFTCQLQPLLVPGYVCVLDSEFVKGGFRLTDVDHNGDSSGGDWKSECHGKRY